MHIYSRRIKLSKYWRQKDKKVQNYQEAVVSKNHHILFFKGNTAVWNITQLYSVEKYYLVDDVWCIFLNPKYSGSREDVADSITKVGLSFFYSTDLKFDDISFVEFTAFIKEQNFWDELSDAKNQDDLFNKMYKKKAL